LTTRIEKTEQDRREQLTPAQYELLRRIAISFDKEVGA
jgi:hypothetical protein